MKTPSLKTTLLANAIFSTGCAVILLAFYQQIAVIMGNHPSWLYLALGIGLLIFAADVALVGTRKTINRKFSQWILWADIGWVVASIVLLVIGQSFLTTTANLLIAGISLMVGLFAVLEYRALADDHKQNILVS